MPAPDSAAAEFDKLATDLRASDLAVLCTDADGTILFSHIGEAMAGDIAADLRPGRRWQPGRSQIVDKFHCHAESVPGAAGQFVAVLAVLSRSNAAAPYAAALARMAARLIAYRCATGAAPFPEGPELAAHRARLGAAERVCGNDPAMKASLKLAQHLAQRGIPLLLAGDTGTGKEVFARALHELSHRYAGPFVAVNCASIPEALIESELFGYRKGAFTGAAREGYRGRILQADGGTLFLDEIGDMPVALQARLLRVLEAREVVPLGGEQPVNVDIQVVSATHRDLEAGVGEGRFREDLYYRLAGMRIELPPLRRRSDRRALLLRVLSEESQGRAVFAPAALELLDEYGWPGNFRELRNAVKVALALTADDIVRPEHLPPAIVSGAAGAPGDERGVLLASIEHHRWNLSAVARRLGISRRTLYRRMHRLGILVATEGGHG
ncbi:MAG: sigma-54-dependent Fis family transcriptional regulator [Rhodocyclaceae bacterium]|nr:sigma-54-dependent Fis family transcriptional regulator [Rhodocyclaceae bacterium]MBK6554336.1 sigma-54-dependent Fis family transcriptional regulator [Rhodocyclaceae bacterium]MBK9310381.1 sigma-54-dependent Fis family transcriptional regulator [Rhodocyclaceae bacterium]MBK9954547.1 sigma-54-dependent Fis family transcriptional regulator [Rhodocyclaceae bacterium]